MKSSRPRSFFLTVILVLAQSALSCGSRDYSGSWQGTTADGKDISFKVQNNTIGKVNLTFSFECEYSGFCPAEESIEADAGSPITGDSFASTVGGVRFSGKFDSPTSVSGELSYEKENPQCGKCKAKSTWTAKKIS